MILRKVHSLALKADGTIVECCTGSGLFLCENGQDFERFFEK
jgi:hypothetical protein